MSLYQPEYKRYMYPALAKINSKALHEQIMAALIEDGEYNKAFRGVSQRLEKRNAQGVVTRQAGLRLYFETELSAENKAKLDAVVEGHKGEPLPHAILLDLVPPLIARKPLTTINYIYELKPEVGRLHPKEEFLGGELVRIVYYLNSDGVNFDTPVVEETFDYTRNKQHFALFRVQLIRWYDTDGKLMDAPIKSRKKFYSPSKSIKEGKRRRWNIINGLELVVLAMMQAKIKELDSTQQTALGTQGLEGEDYENKVLEIGRTFLKNHRPELELWAEAHVKDIRVSIQDASDVWLDLIGATHNNIPVTIRGVILNELS